MTLSKAEVVVNPSVQSVTGPAGVITGAAGAVDSVITCESVLTQLLPSVPVTVKVPCVETVISEVVSDVLHK